METKRRHNGPIIQRRTHDDSKGSSKLAIQTQLRRRRHGRANGNNRRLIMDDITKALLDQRKEEIRQWQNTYKEATAEAVNILNNEPEGEDWDTVREAIDTAQRALENIKGLQEEVEMIQMLNI